MKATESWGLYTRARWYLDLAVAALMRELDLQAHIARLEAALRAAHRPLAAIASGSTDTRDFLTAHRAVATGMDAILEREASHA